MQKLSRKQFGIDLRNFTKGKKISSGGFGDVFVAQYQKTGESYAAKVLKRDPSKPNTQKLIENEVQISMDIDHPTIIKFLGYSLLDFNQCNNVTLLMKLAKNHSLDEIIERADRSAIPRGYDNTTRQIILIGVACGLKYLHQNGIIHRDVKSNNILLDENLHPLITDFGTAKYFDKKHPIEQPQQICGTLPYMAPEMITGSKYCYKIDVYSFGILMFEIITDTEAYPHLEKKDSVINEFKKRVVKFNYRPSFKEEIKYELKNLIEKCWSSDPSERPSFDELFEKLQTADYFLDNVNEKKVQEYVASITKSEAEPKPEKEKFTRSYYRNDTRELNQLKKMNEQLRSDNAQLNVQLSKLKEENRQMALKIDTLTKKIQNYQNNEPSTASIQESKISCPTVFVIPPSNQKKEVETAPRIQPKCQVPVKYSRSQRSIYSHNNNKHSDDYDEDDEDYDENEYSPRTPTRPHNLIGRDRKDDKQYYRTPQRPATSRDRREDMFMRSQIIKDIKAPRRNSPQMNEKRGGEEEIFAKTLIIKDKKDENSFINKVQRRSSPQPNERKNEEDLFAKSQIIKEKRNEDYSLKSSPRSPQQSNERIDDEVLFKLPPLRKAKSDDATIKSLSFIISVSEFNSYSLQLQHSFISKISLNAKGRLVQFYKKLENLINYLLKFVKSEASNFIEIQTENPKQSLDKIKEFDCVNLLSNATEILYLNKSLDSFEFMSILQQFSQVSIEIKYMSKIYMGSYKIISNKLSNNHIKPNIFISGVKRTDNTFKGNELINSVKLDNSVTSIGDYAFKGCSSLKYVSIPSSVTSIGSGSFEGCTSLMQVSIPSSVPSIPIGLFKGCSSLEQVSLLESLKVIRSSAFFGCSSLNQIVIPSSVTFIGDHAFDGCTSLSKVTIPSSVISIGEFAFNRCKSLKDVFVPDSVASIGVNAFSKCSSLEKITVPSAVKNVKEFGIPPKVSVSII